MTTPKPAKPKNLSLRQKSHARMAAVQGLYRLKVMDEHVGADKLMEDVLASWEQSKIETDPEFKADEDPDKALLKKIINGAVPELDRINATITPHLAADWKMDRMSPLLVSILQAATYELMYHDNLATHIIIDEYVALAGEFFDSAEQNFTHGILQVLAKEIRV
jgi:transcription antitermination factor NusB